MSTELEDLLRAGEKRLLVRDLLGKNTPVHVVDVSDIITSVDRASIVVAVNDHFRKSGLALLPIQEAARREFYKKRPVRQFSHQSKLPKPRTW